MYNSGLLGTVEGEASFGDAIMEDLSDGTRDLAAVGGLHAGHNWVDMHGRLIGLG